MNRPDNSTRTGDVVYMQRFRSGKSLSPLRQAEAYWSALREDTGVPRRSQIDPRGLAGVLRYTFILERIAPGIARLRLSGQHLVTLAGMEVRGMPLSAFFVPSARDEIGRMLETLFDGPAVLEADLVSEAPRGQRPIEARLLLLPLRNERNEVTRALGVLVADHEVEPRDPLRFSIAGSEMRPVDGVAAPAAVAPQTPPPVATGFAEAPAPLRGAPYLRLVKSDKD
jgi:hypothetical protein